MISDMETKVCKTCRIEKPVSDYYRANGGTTLFPECKRCNSDRAREWHRNRRKQDPTYASNNRMRASYGIGLVEYEAMLAAQGGGCAVCAATKPGGRGKRFHVDHDHETGAVRGLLCHACNVAIGTLGDDTDRLLAAATYVLRTHDMLKAVVF
jgi:hypothetical protein